MGLRYRYRNSGEWCVWCNAGGAPARVSTLASNGESAMVYQDVLNADVWGTDFTEGFVQFESADPSSVSIGADTGHTTPLANSYTELELSVRVAGCAQPAGPRHAHSVWVNLLPDEMDIDGGDSNGAQFPSIASVDTSVTIPLRMKYGNSTTSSCLGTVVFEIPSNVSFVDWESAQHSFQFQHNTDLFASPVSAIQQSQSSGATQSFRVVLIAAGGGTCVNGESVSLGDLTLPVRTDLTSGNIYGFGVKVLSLAGRDSGAGATTATCVSLVNVTCEQPFWPRSARGHFVYDGDGASGTIDSTLDFEPDVAAEPSSNRCGDQTLYGDISVTAGLATQGIWRTCFGMLGARWALLLHVQVH